MKDLIIKNKSPRRLGPKYGFSYPREGVAQVRSDLPKWVWMSVMVHEAYHCNDRAKNWLWREVKAVSAQLFIPFLGGIACIAMTLADRKRLRYYMDRVRKRR